MARGGKGVRHLLLLACLLLSASVLALGSPQSGGWGDEGEEEEEEEEGELRMPSEPGSAQRRSAGKEIRGTWSHALGTASDFFPAARYSAALSTSGYGSRSESLQRLAVDWLPLPKQAQYQLQDLVGSGAWYHMRIPSSLALPADSLPTAFVLASIKLDCLAASSFVATLHLQLGEGDSVVAADLAPSVDCAAHSEPHTQPERPLEVLKFGVKLHKPSTASLRPPLPEAERDYSADTGAKQGAQGEVPIAPPPPKTFWQKYWMFIMPAGLIVVNIMLGAATPEIGSGQSEPTTVAAGGAGGSSRAAGSIRGR